MIEKGDYAAAWRESRVLALILLGLILSTVLVFAVYHFILPTPSAEPGPGPNQWFAQMYDLVPGEYARMMPPPYSPARDLRYRSTRVGRVTTQPVSGQMLFHAGKMQGSWGWFSEPSWTMRMAVSNGGSLTAAMMEVSTELGNLPVTGDWTIRIEAPREERLKAAESILRQALQRGIVIEPARRKREVIVARGSYRFMPLERGRRPETVQLFTDTLDPVEGAGGGTGTFERLLQQIEDATARQVISEVTGPPVQVSWSHNSTRRNARTDPEMLKLFLQNLKSQTSLELEVRDQEVEVFLVREEE